MNMPHPRRKTASPGSFILAGVLAMFINSASAEAPGAKEGLLASCPDSNNCVSSNALEDKSRIAPFKIAISPERAWTDLQKMIEANPDVKVVQVTPSYMHAEYSTKWLRFTDDVEFLLRPEQREIAVRSESRTGYYDFGANRKRIEALRTQLRETGIIE